MTQPKMDAKVADKKPWVGKLEPGTYWWCACGRSQTQPWCDGSHAGTGIEPREVEITEARNYAMCQCKATANTPFCDGAHAKL
ncbi:MAG: CDGSH-type Zn-finger protein [Myxococcota bacterium]|jgi:CDGSH-type Zn-finger protein